MPERLSAMGAAIAVSAFGAAGTINVPVRVQPDTVQELRLPGARSFSNGAVVIEFLPSVEDLPYDLLTAADVMMLEHASSVGADDFDYAAFLADIDDE